MKTIYVKDVNEIPNNFTGIIVFTTGNTYWYLDGKLHREDGPAIHCLNGEKEWWLNGKLHREEGPCTACKDCLEGNFVLCTKPGPAVIYSSGTKHWYLNDKLHREDGPAVEGYNNYKEWWLNGKLTDKKAVELYYMLKYKKIIKM